MLKDKHVCGPAVREERASRGACFRDGIGGIPWARVTISLGYRVSRTMEVVRRTKIAEAAYKMIQGQRLKAAQKPAFLGCDVGCVCVCVFSQGGCAPPRA